MRPWRQLEPDRRNAWEDDVKMTPEVLTRVLHYIHLGYSVTRIVQLFGVKEKAVDRLKRRFG